MIGRVRIALVLLSAAVIGAGALGGWRVSVRFVGAGALVGAGPQIREDGSPMIKRSHPFTTSIQSGAARSTPAPAAVSPAAPDAAPPRADPPAALVPAAKHFTGLHMTFPREWHPVTYEIGSPRPRPPVRVLCQACPAVNWATNTPIDQSTDQEKVVVNAATVGALTVVGGRVTLLEWDP